MSELLWSVLCKEKGRDPSKRGVGMSFVPDITHKYLSENNLKFLKRPHHMKLNEWI